MKLEALNSWLTLLSNVGVIAGIVFLALELQEGQKLASTQAIQDRNQSLADWQLRIAESAELSKLAYRASSGDELSEEEMMRFRAVQIASVNRMDATFFQYEQGYLPDEFYEYNFKNMIRLSAPNWRVADVWPWRPAFKAEVERILKENE